MSLPPRLHLNPVVIELSLRLEYIPTAVAGMVRAAWEYFQEQVPTGAGILPKGVLDTYIRSDGFAQALEAAGMAHWEGDEVMITWAAPKASDAWQASPQPSERDRERERKRAYRARTRLSIDSVPLPVPPVPNCPVGQMGQSGTNGPGASEKAGHVPELSQKCPGTEFAKLASLNTKDKTEEWEGANERARRLRSLVDDRARFLKILLDAGIPQDQAVLIIASPQGTPERITWAIETLAKRCEDARSRGKKINRPDKYLQTLLFKADNGPGIPAQKPIGGENPISPQQRKLRQLAALKEARAAQ